MRIHVEGDIFITGDSMGYSLAKRSISNSGKTKGQEIFIGFSHHPSVQSCAKKLLKMKITDSTAKNLKELIADVGKIEAELMSKISF